MTAKYKEIFILFIFFLALQAVIESSCRASTYPAVITDSDGKGLVIKRPFSRIISLYPAHTENIIAMGAGRKLVGVSRSGAAIKGLPEGCRTVGYRDDLERLLVLKPDLVLIRPMISRSHPNLAKGLEKGGVTVVSLQPITPEDLYQYWKSLGILTGRQEAAEKMAAAFRQGLLRLGRKTENIARDKRKHVYFEAIHRRMKTFAPGSLQIFCLESAGGINVASDALRVRNTNIAQYGKERILAKAHEIDVFLAQKGRMNPVTRADIINEPGFQVIKAVRKGQVYLVDETVVSRPTPRLLEGMERIFHILYPDISDGE